MLFLFFNLPQQSLNPVYHGPQGAILPQRIYLSVLGRNNEEFKANMKQVQDKRKAEKKGIMQMLHNCFWMEKLKNDKIQWKQLILLKNKNRTRQRVTKNQILRKSEKPYVMFEWHQSLQETKQKTHYDGSNTEPQPCHKLAHGPTGKDSAAQCQNVQDNPAVFVLIHSLI